MRTRKLIGTVLMFIWVCVYALLAVSFLSVRVAHWSPLAQLATYSIAGIAWLPVAMLIVWWMAKDKRQAR